MQSIGSNHNYPFLISPKHKLSFCDITYHTISTPSIFYGIHLHSTIHAKEWLLHSESGIAWAAFSTGTFANVARRLPTERHIFSEAVCQCLDMTLCMIKMVDKINSFS